MSDGTPAAPPSGTPVPQTNAPTPEAPKTLKIKDAEFKSEEDAYAEIQRGRQSGKLLTEAQKRLHEANRKEKDFEALVGEVKTKKDARKVIEKLGLSKEEAVEVFGKWLYENEVLPKEMSPEQRRIKELEAQVAAKNEAEAKAKEEQDRAQLDQETKREEAKLREELTKLIHSKKIPGTRLALRRVANYLASYAEAGAEVSPDQAADMVAADYKQEFGELFDEASPEQLAEFFGEAKWRALAKKVSAWALSRARGSAKIPDVQVKSRPPAPKEEKLNPQEFMRFIRSVK